MEQGVTTGEGPTPPPPETEKLEFKMVSSLKLDEETNPCTRLSVIGDSNNINAVDPTAVEQVPAANLQFDSVEEIACDKPTARLVTYPSTPGTL